MLAWHYETVIMISKSVYNKMKSAQHLRRAAVKMAARLLHESHDSIVTTIISMYARRVFRKGISVEHYNKLVSLGRGVNYIDL